MLGSKLKVSYSPCMPWKDKEKQREAIRKHYNANRQYYIYKAYKKREALRKWVYEYKNITPCKDCGIQYPYYVTDFDHLGGESGIKLNTVSRLINSGSTKQVKEEIAKCELVCSNCHRIRTFNRIKDKNKI
jgi:hypothetical protein